LTDQPVDLDQPRFGHTVLSAGVLAAKPGVAVLCASGWFWVLPHFFFALARQSPGLLPTQGRSQQHTRIRTVITDKAFETKKLAARAAISATTVPASVA
jgi:hypothetical protein